MAVTKGFQTHKDAKGFTEEDKRLIDDAVEYWMDRCPLSIAACMWDDTHPKGPDFKTLFSYERFSCVTTLSVLPFGLPMPDWEELLSKGLNWRIAKAEKKMRELKLWDRNDPKVVEKYDFYRAVIMSLKAVIKNAHRYAALAKKMAQKETDPVRRQELLRIAETCKWVPAKPPRNFYEAVQFHWFIIAAALIEEAACGTGPQRFPLYMYPYYKKDIDEGQITREEAIELLEFLFLKYKETGFLTDISKKGNEGQTSKYFTLGGLTADGKDATNEMDFLLLETQRRLRLPEPALTLLWHNKLSDEFLHEVVRVIRTGIGQPQLQNNDVAIQREIHHHGCSVEEAREGVATTYCVSMGLKNSGFLYGGTFNGPKLIELVFNNGLDPIWQQPLGLKTGEVESLTSWEKFWEAFRKQLEFFSHAQREMNCLEISQVQQVIPQVFRSAITNDCIDRGLDWLSGGARYPVGGPLFTAGTDVVNSLAAVKKLVYDDKKITLSQLKEALAANFVGFEDIQKMCLDAPKFGNDIEYVDQIARQFWDVYYDIYQDSPCNRDVKGSRPEPYSIAMHTYFGMVTGALPTGRTAGTALTDASVSAMPGTDTHGPTALIKSAAGAMDTVKYGCNHLNVRFHPNAIEGDQGERNLLNLIRSYMDLGGSHIQFNSVSTETLRDAQVHPENHKDLVVRVAGFSAFFIHVDTMVQEEVIKRSELVFGQ